MSSDKIWRSVIDSDVQAVSRCKDIKAKKAIERFNRKPWIMAEKERNDKSRE